MPQFEFSKDYVIRSLVTILLAGVTAYGAMNIRVYASEKEVAINKAVMYENLKRVENLEKCYEKTSQNIENIKEMTYKIDKKVDVIQAKIDVK